MLHVMRKVISRLISTVLFLLLLLTVFAVIANQASGGQIDVFGYQVKAVLSGSMEPEFQTGSIIVIESIEDTTQFEQGDIITFQNAEGLTITHRIEEVMDNGAQYVTKGDNNNGIDVEPVLAENIIGQYTGITIPYVGYGINFASSREGALFLLILPGTLLIGYSLIIIRRALKQVESINEKEPEVSNNH